MPWVDNVVSWTYNIIIVHVNVVDYCCVIYTISKSEAIQLLENSVLEGRGNISDAYLRNQY